jgi:hypothetical protein
VAFFIKLPCRVTVKLVPVAFDEADTVFGAALLRCACRVVADRLVLSVTL